MSLPHVSVEPLRWKYTVLEELDVAEAPMIVVPAVSDLLEVHIEEAKASVRPSSLRRMAPRKLHGKARILST